MNLESAKETLGFVRNVCLAPGAIGAAGTAICEAVGDTDRALLAVEFGAPFVGAAVVCAAGKKTIELAQRSHFGRI